MASINWYTVVIRGALRKLFDLGRADLFGTYPDEAPPPAGYPSWQAYIDRKELSEMTDFLPLGDPAEGAKVNLVWTRVGEDVATCGLHFVHRNPDIVGDTLAFTGDEAAALEALLDALWVDIRAHFPSSITLDRYEWHHFGVGVRRPNPRFRETSGLAAGGTGATDLALPPQVAESVTLKTDHRKTWGRVYLPSMIKDECDTGRIVADTVAHVRTAFGTLLDGADAADTPLVIWSPRRDGAALQYGEAAHAASLDNPDVTSFAKGVTQVQVDDLFDVQRSRRFDKPLIRDTHTLGA